MSSREHAQSQDQTTKQGDTLICPLSILYGAIHLTSCTTARSLRAGIFCFAIISMQVVCNKYELLNGNPKIWDFQSVMFSAAQVIIPVQTPDLRTGGHACLNAGTRSMRVSPCSELRKFPTVGPCVVAKKRNPARFLGNFMTWAAERPNFWGLARTVRRCVSRPAKQI